MSSERMRLRNTSYRQAIISAGEPINGSLPVRYEALNAESRMRVSIYQEHCGTQVVSESHENNGTTRFVDIPVTLKAGIEYRLSLEVDSSPRTPIATFNFTLKPADEATAFRNAVYAARKNIEIT